MSEEVKVASATSMGSTGHSGKASRVRTVPLLRLFDGPPVSAQRSRTMSRIRGKRTGPELKLRSLLRSRRYRFRYSPPGIAGRPDIVHWPSKTAVLIDGCFWHGCPRHFRLPRTRAQFWAEKIRRNQARRERVRAELVGWKVVEVFECELRERPEAMSARVVSALARRPSARRGRPA